MTKTDRANIILNSAPSIIAINLLVGTGLVLVLFQIMRIIAHITIWMGIY
jgi:hypothetical protein